MSVEIERREAEAASGSDGSPIAEPDRIGLPAASMPAIVPPEQDPLAVLRAALRFTQDNRGIAEIIGSLNGHIEAGYRADGDAYSRTIGLAVLSRNPEAEPITIYCARSREIRHMRLSDWLRARGYEPRAWQRKGGMTMIGLASDDDVKWELHTGAASVPMLPPDPPSAGAALSPQVVPSQNAGQWCSATAIAGGFPDIWRK